jgi:hypothetical protein
MLAGAFGALIGPFTINVSAAPDTHVWDGDEGDQLASTGTNWVSDIAPESGDSLVFNAGALSCNMDFEATFNTLSMNSGFTGYVSCVSATNWGTTGDIVVESGTLAGKTTATITCGGSVLHTGGTLAGSPTMLLNFNMVTDETIFSSYTNVSIRHLRIMANVSIICGTLFRTDYRLTVDAGKILTVDNPTVIVLWGQAVTGACIWNSGTIAGTGVIRSETAAATVTISPGSLGTITTKFEVALRTGATQNTKLVLSSNTVIGNSITVFSDHAIYTATLDLSSSNYSLSATDIMVGPGGILDGRGSVISCAGNWDSSDGSFTQGSSKLYMTGGRSGNTLAVWSAAASGSLTFSVPNLVNGTTYVVFIDGAREHSLVADGSGIVQFTYSGPWSEHQFKVIRTSIPENIFPLVNMVLVFFALAIAMSVIGFALSSKDKGVSKNEFIEMVVFVLISVIMMGALEVVLGSF